MNLKNYKKWLKAIEPELKSIRATTGSVAVVRSVLNIPQKVTSTRWASKQKSDRSSKARQAVLGWKQKHGSIDCVITFVCRFDLLPGSYYSVCKENQYSRYSKRPGRLDHRQK